MGLFRAELRHFRAHALACGLTLGALAAGFVGADHITTLAEDHFYQDRPSSTRPRPTSASWSPQVAPATSSS